MPFLEDEQLDVPEMCSNTKMIRIKESNNKKKRITGKLDEQEQFISNELRREL